MNIKSSLTLRYATALGLVASVLIVTHITSGDRLRSGEQHARLIDVSGMQRMLSQRIALLSVERVIVSDAALLRANEDKLRTSIGRMQANHAELSADWRQRALGDDPLYSGYLAGDGIGAEVDRFLTAAQRLVDGDAPSNEADSRANEGFVLAEALDGVFLDRLNGVLQRYTHEAQMHTVHLRRYETMTLLFGLAVLLIEAVFIFRPMVDKVAWCIGVLDEANEELRLLATSVSTKLRTPIVDSIGLIKQVDEALTSGKVSEASAATRSVYTSMITLDGVVGELLEVVGRHREAVVNFATLGRHRHRPETDTPPCVAVDSPAQPARSKASATL